MKILSVPGEFQRIKGRVFGAVGVFDGVHLGHQKILEGLIDESRRAEGVALVVTFDKHPSTVVAPEKVPPFIYPLQKRLEVIRALGPDVLWLIPFDEVFSLKSGAQFSEELARSFAPLASVWVGADFRFGHKRSGDLNVLRETGARFGFTVRATPAVLSDGQTVSSTRIRDAIARGDFDVASSLLGRPYTLSGKVVEGDRLGRRMGFPTANLDVTGLAVPPNGVYAVTVQIEGQAHQAVLNLGFRPTLSPHSRELRCEVHLLDFSGNLYGCSAEVKFLGKLREEARFANAEELRLQIARDIAAAQRLF